MNQSRLFTFGCSFTQYVWPTWADILGQEFQFYENWGLAGAGNQFIFNSIIECNLRNKLQKNDTVIIMWTSITRIDRYIGHQWLHTGSLFSIETKKYNNINDARGFLIRDLAAMSAVIAILDDIGCNYQFHSKVPIGSDDDEVSDVVELYNDTIDKIAPSVLSTIYNNKWSSLHGVDLLYLRKHQHAKVLLDFQELYDKLAGSEWPSYDNFIKNNMAGVSLAVLTEIAEHNLFNRCIAIDKQFKNNLLTRLRNIFISPVEQELHPLPNSHLSYIQKVMPGFNISNETIAWTNMHHDAVINNKIIKFDRHQPQRL